MCWGRDDGGQLGDAGTGTQRTPVPVLGVADAVTVWAGGWHSCVLRASGVRSCWGWNAGGVLGNDMVSNATPIVDVSTLTGIVSFALGAEHTCGVAAGTVHCWGKNYNGEIGNGTRADQVTAAPVVGLP